VRVSDVESTVFYEGTPYLPVVLCRLFGKCIACIFRVRESPWELGIRPISAIPFGLERRQCVSGPRAMRITNIALKHWPLCYEDCQHCTETLPPLATVCAFCNSKTLFAYRQCVWWRYGSTIFYLCTKWRLMMSFTPLPLYPLGKCPIVGPPSRPGLCNADKVLTPAGNRS
jgi:hypothetical protein